MVLHHPADHFFEQSKSSSHFSNTVNLLRNWVSFRFIFFVQDLYLLENATQVILNDINLIKNRVRTLYQITAGQYNNIYHNKCFHFYSVNLNKAPISPFITTCWIWDILTSNFDIIIEIWLLRHCTRFSCTPSWLK